MRFLGYIVTALLLGGGGWLGFRSVRHEIAASTYRQRLADVAAQYESLRADFNAAVRRTTVTELLVDDGALSIAIRAADGTRTVVATDLDPRDEIYVDYVVLDGRLLIRRVFDAWTAPKDAVVLDPELVDIDWDDPRADHGKAIYRALGPGRWVVSVTGAGALGLVRLGDVDATDPSDLVRAPELTDFSEVVSTTDSELAEVGVGDAWRWMLE
jgi:hypothetical protein